MLYVRVLALMIGYDERDTDNNNCAFTATPRQIVNCLMRYDNVSDPRTFTVRKSGYTYTSAIQMHYVVGSNCLYMYIRSIAAAFAYFECSLDSYI